MATSGKGDSPFLSSWLKAHAQLRRRIEPGNADSDAATLWGDWLWEELQHSAVSVEQAAQESALAVAQHQHATVTVAQQTQAADLATAQVNGCTLAAEQAAQSAQASAVAVAPMSLPTGGMPYAKRWVNSASVATTQRAQQASIDAVGGVEAANYLVALFDLDEDLAAAA